MVYNRRVTFHVAGCEIIFFSKTGQDREAKVRKTINENSYKYKTYIV